MYSISVIDWAVVPDVVEVVDTQLLTYGGALVVDVVLTQGIVVATQEVVEVVEVVMEVVLVV